MSGLGAWIWGTSQLDDAIDRATSELLPSGSEDIALNLEICDQIRSKSAPAKDAMRAIKRRLNHKNPNVQLLALSLNDVCVKNGGDLFLKEIASREFMDNLVSLLKTPTLNFEVKNMMLLLIQNWSVAFEGKYELSYVGQVYKTLQNEGFKFPPKDLAVANSAMIDTQTAPEWIDSEVCLRCRTAFTFTNRKHHCRNCGQVFDQQCSSKSMALPHFGITQEVRVCDGCYNKLTRKAERSAPPKQERRHRSGQSLEDAELQRAIQLSLQENQARPGYAPSQNQWHVSEPPIVDRSTYSSRKPATVDEEEDEELKAAIEASLREANAPKPSAPVVESSKWEEQQPVQSHVPKIPNYDLDPMETDTILTFNQTVEQVQAQGGRDLSRYPAVTELYDKASGLRPKLALSLDDTGRKEEILSEMHKNLSEAVRLYDQILTQQVSQPRWRAAAMSPPVPAYNTAPQWAPQQLQPQATGSIDYGASQWAPQQLQPQETGYTVSSEPQFVHQSMASQPQSQWNSQQQYAQPQYTPSAPQFQPSSPTSSISQTPQPSYRYPSQTLPPVTLGQAPPPPPVQASSPVQTAYQPAQPLPSTSTLSRHNTIASTSTANHLHLVRSNTVSSTTSHQQHVQRFAPSQEQARQALIASAPLPPSNVPFFPAAPTAVPQFSPYGVEQKEERKEAMLIDL